MTDQHKTRHLSRGQWVFYGFLAIIGFLLQWPTILTLAMFPILVYMYIRLARTEEKEAHTEFGEEYSRYADRVPAFFPRLGPSS